MSPAFTGSAVRVLIVDDSAFMRVALSRMIACEPGLEVAGTAGSGSEALDKLRSLDPDIVTLDVQMPGLSGLETLRAIMNYFPRPVIMVSATTEENAGDTVQALALGAFDYVPKRLSATTLDILHVRNNLIAKLHAAADARRPPESPVSRRPVRRATSHQEPASCPALVAIGASTGGPKTLLDILTPLPRDLSVPILVVQHMPAGFTAPLAQRLDSLCSLAVREAVDGEPIRPGVVYIAPAGWNMTVERFTAATTVIRLDSRPVSNCPHMPSVDVMMKSVAETFHDCALGIILTGMGSDGAEGMKAIQLHGGTTIGQDEASCVVYGMPRACAELGLLHRVLPPCQIPGYILTTVGYRKQA